MKGHNIILQHYTGNPNNDEVVSRSLFFIEKYSKLIGADYKFISGNVFREHLSPPCQKMIMLDPMWDDYEYVVMMDTDMFPVKGLKENVFTDISGIGLHIKFTTNIWKACIAKFPDLCSKEYGYWGGCLWRLNRELRIKLRKHIRENELNRFNGSFEDEGIMHRLATLAKIKLDPIPDTWSFCSYRPGIDKAKIVHIRKKIDERGLIRRPKIENYFDLVRRGILEE